MSQNNKDKELNNVINFSESFPLIGLFLDLCTYN